MDKRYLKDEDGIVRAITTNNLQLEKPLISDNYDINVHNRNMDKIDEAINEVKGKVDGLELKAEKVTLADPTNVFTATNVEDALLENKTSISNLKTKVDNGQNHKLTSDDGTAINISNNDINNYKKYGSYMGSNVINAPDNGWWFFEVKAHNDKYIVQDAIQFTDPNSPRMTRSCVNGVWGKWRSL